MGPSEWDNGPTESNWATEKTNKMDGMRWNEAPPSGWSSIVKEDKVSPRGVRECGSGLTNDVV